MKGSASKRPGLASANNGVAGTEKITKRIGDVKAVVPKSSLYKTSNRVNESVNASAQQVSSEQQSQH